MPHLGIEIMKGKKIYSFWLVVLTSIVFGQKDTITKFSNLSIDTMGNLKFTISYFGKGFSGCIEQYKNGKWISIRELSTFKSVIRATPASSTENKLVVPLAARKTDTDSCIVKFHRGINRYRIKSLKPYSLVSHEIELNSKVSNDDGSLWIAGNKIFRNETGYYEIMTSGGDVVLKGSEKVVDISSLSPGSYFLYTKTSTAPFTK